MSEKATNLSNVLKGNLCYMILRVLKKKPLHGYAIIKEIETITGDMWKPTTGSVYPTLAQMQKDKLISMKESQTKGRKKKVYLITKQGQAELNERKKGLAGLIKQSSEMFQHLIPKEMVQQPSELLSLMNESKLFQKDLQEVKLNMLKVLRLSKEGKIGQKEKEKISKKLAETNKLIAEIIASKK